MDERIRLGNQGIVDKLNKTRLDWIKEFKPFKKACIQSNKLINLRKTSIYFWSSVKHKEVL